MRKPIGLTAPYREEDDDDIQDYKKPWVGLNWDDLPEIYVGDKAFMQGASGQKPNSRRRTHENYRILSSLYAPLSRLQM